jgi:membrane protease YdiL (CAAX protease family)
MLYWLLLAFAMVFPFFWLRIIKKYSWKKTINELLPKIKDPKIELIGALRLFLLLFVAFVILSMILSVIGLNDLDKVANFIEQEREDLLGFGVIVTVILFVEEFFFRAFLIKRIGMFWSTIIFAAAHISYGSVAEVIGVFALGLILAYWYKKNNSLAQNYLAHVLYDLVAILTYLVF